MAILPIVIVGEPVLHRRAEPVGAVTDEIRALVADMVETNSAANGAGLAAPQIGVGLRIFVWSMANDDGVPDQGHILNPFVRSTKPPVGRADPDEESEGCLSVPGEHFPLRRGEQSEVSGVDLDGNPVEFVATGWFARCMQHEYDHLNGFLYIDRLEGSAARKARKAVKKQRWGVPGLTWMPGVDRDPFGHDDVDDHDDCEHDHHEHHHGHGHGHEHDDHAHDAGPATNGTSHPSPR